MAHFAIQIGKLAVELEDEDMDGKEIVELGERVLHNAVALFNDDDDEEDDD